MTTNGILLRMSDNGKKQHSAELAKGLAQAAKSLATRPSGLRGPFILKSGPKDATTKK